MTKKLAELWDKVHECLLGADSGVIIVSLIMAVIASHASQLQRCRIDMSLQDIFDNQPVLSPLLTMFVLITLGYLYFVFKYNEKMPHGIAVKMGRMGEHGIMLPLLYVVMFFFDGDVTKSCSAEIIITAILIVIILDALFITVCLYYALRNMSASD